MSRLIVILCLTVLSGCANHLEKLSASVKGKDIHVVEHNGLPVLIASPAQSTGVRHMRVFIEGDGRAWITRSSPSLDPTPTQSFLVGLSQQEPASAYMARPCQYVASEKCSIPYWTSHRFSREVLSAMSAALDTLRQRYGTESFELVGYSGGGAMALLLAGSRSDVTSVQTMAGNLAPTYWTQSRNLTPMAGSLDPQSMRDQLRNIPQRHFYGVSDQVVPPGIARHYSDSIGSSACIDLVAVEATHSSGWPSIWSQNRGRPLPCSAPAKQ